MKRNRSLIIFVSAVVIVIISTAVISMLARPRGRQIEVRSNFTFDNQAATNFYAKLKTSAGLLSVVPRNNTVYVADDQQSDFATLLKLGDSSPSR